VAFGPADAATVDLVEGGLEAGPVHGGLKGIGAAADPGRLGWVGPGRPGSAERAVGDGLGEETLQRGHAAVSSAST
jgi:hypothetical protein